MQNKSVAERKVGLVTSLWCLLLLWQLLPQQSSAKAPLTIKGYLTEIIKIDEDLRAQAEQLKIAESQLRVSQDYFQNSLKFEAAETHTEQTLSGGNSATAEQYFRYSTLFVGVNQKTAWGMDVNFGLTDRIDNEITSSSVVKSDRVLKLSQSLWKNSFGQLQRLRTNQSKYNMISLRSTYEAKKLAVCEAGILQFIKLFDAQQKAAIYEKLSLLSKKSLKFMVRAYKKRMVRKIDYLIAITDALRLKALFEAKHNDLIKESIVVGKTLYHPGEWPVHIKNSPIVVASPARVLDQWYLSMADGKFNNHSLLKAVHAEVTRELLAVQIASEESELDLNLGLDIGWRETDIYSVSPSQDFIENYMIVKLSMEWPFFNPTNRERVIQATSGLALANRKREALEKSLQTLYLQKQSDLASLRKIQKLSEEQLVGYQQQIGEAQNLLYAGKMEFESYVRYRDSYLNQEISHIELKSNLWRTGATLAQLSNGKSDICLEGKL